MSSFFLNYIQDNNELAKAISRILSKNPAYIAVDTEFTRQTTYWPQLEVIQLGIEGEPILVVDCRSITDWSPLCALLVDPMYIKVFHSARQDIEGFFHLFNLLPKGVFDLQIAAAFMGFGHSVGLVDLVDQLLGEEINKDQQHSDWQQRPLRDVQIEYAAKDVYYLLQLYPCVMAQLESLGRTSWLSEFNEALESQAKIVVDPKFAWVKLRAHLKNTTELHFCMEFTALRERLAQKNNCNRNRVISDADIIALSQKMADLVQREEGTLLHGSRPDLEFDFGSVLNSVLGSVSSDIRGDFEHAQKESLKAFGELTNVKQLRTHLKYGAGAWLKGSQQQKLFEAKTRLASEANRLVIPMNYLAPTAMLEDYIVAPRDDHPLISRWRAAIVKPVLDAVMGAVDGVGFYSKPPE